MANTTTKREQERAEAQDRLDDLRVTYILTEPEAWRVVNLVEDEGQDEEDAVEQVRGERVGAAKRAAADPTPPKEVFDRSPKLHAKWIQLRKREADEAEQAERDRVGEIIKAQEEADEAGDAVTDDDENLGSLGGFAPTAQQSATAGNQDADDAGIDTDNPVSAPDPNDNDDEEGES